MEERPENPPSGAMGAIPRRGSSFSSPSLFVSLELFPLTRPDVLSLTLLLLVRLGIGDTIATLGLGELSPSRL